MTLSVGGRMQHRKTGFKWGSEQSPKAVQISILFILPFKQCEFSANLYNPPPINGYDGARQKFALSVGT